MTCPECGSESAVWDIAKAREELYRKRKCKVCGLKFCTIEYEVEYDENFRKEWVKYNRACIRSRNRKNRGQKSEN